MPGDTEVLTKSGWRRIDEWEGGEIAQVSPDLWMDFLPATRFIGPAADSWVRVDSPCLSIDMTLGHTVPYLTEGKRAWKTMQAGDLLSRSRVFLPTTGRLRDDGSITPEQMRVLVMVQADGHFDRREGRATTIRLAFKKARKIKRAGHLLSSAGVKYTLREKESDGRQVFYIANRDIPEWLSEDRKFFGAWLLDSTQLAREAFVEELPFWDGTTGAEHRKYVSGVKLNAEWAHTLCHITNQQASFREERNTNGNPIYVVAIKRRNTGASAVKWGHTSVVETTKQSYCPETQTGFWLARANGTIFITGNTGRWSGGDGLNVQNLANLYKSDIRLAFRAPAGQKVVVVDSSQIELRISAWFCGQESILETLRAGGDVYRNEAANQFNIAPEEVVKGQRNFGKATTLGCGFGMGAPKFRKYCAAGPLGLDPIYLSPSEAFSAIQKYRSNNPMIPAMWRTLDHFLHVMSLPGACEQLGPVTFMHNMVVLPSGRCLLYPNLRQSDSGSWAYGGEGKKASFIWGGTLLENIIQALARDVVAYQMLKIEERFRIVSSTHDEAIYLAAAEEAEAALQYGLAVFSESPDWMADCPLGAEGGFDDMYSK